MTEPSANGQARPPVPDPATVGGRGPTQAELLIGYARSEELFTAPDGEAYATVRTGGTGRPAR